MERTNGEYYSMERKLGQGVFGDCHLARDTRDGSFVALKRIFKRPEKMDSLRNSFYQEIRSGKLLNQCNGIAQLKGFFESSRHFWLVLEYVEGIELISHLVERDYEPFTEDEALPIFVQILSAVSLAHSNKVAHLDLKLDNVLIDKEMKIKLIDWGLSVSDNADKCFKLCGSPEYAAPEIWNRLPDVPYDAFKADMFSLGVILYALLYGRFPYGKQALQLMRKGFAVGQIDLPGDMSHDVKDLLKGMLHPNPSKRYSLTDVEKHAWLSDLLAASSAS